MTVVKSTQEVNIQLIPMGKADLYTPAYSNFRIFPPNFRILTQQSKHSFRHIMKRLFNPIK